MNIKSSDMLGENLGYFGKISSPGTSNSVLPPQSISENKKTRKWIESNLDNLEKEGLKQYVENLPMSDYYKMMSGEMAYVDIIDDDTDVLYSYIQKSKKKLGLPSYLKHWDLMYPVVSKITGEWALQKDTFRFDTTDEISTNDYIREKTFRLSKYTEAVFKSQMNKFLVDSGIDISGNFKSEQEYREYQNQLEQIKRDYFPEKIDEFMKKNWKTEAAQWAGRTWERDYERFKMAQLELLENIDIVATGKSPRLYRVGYDYYFPEHWHPIETFHSKESSVRRFEDCEFAGRIKYYTVTELMTTYGHRLSEEDRNNIYKSYFGPDYDKMSRVNDTQGSVNILGTNYYQTVNVPFKGYSDHLLALEFENATGIKLSQTTDTRTNETVDSFSKPLFNRAINFGSRIAQSLRTDIEIRTDTIQTVEAYWKGSKKIGLLSYREKSGYLTTVEVDEDILSEVKKEYNITNLKKVSLMDFKELKPEEKENTIIWVDVPVVYEGVKINCTGLYNDSDAIYFAREMKFQIRGEKGNVFDVKLPVCGHIGESLCKKIRPEQIIFNYLNNQSQGYLEKEIGSFFVIDMAGVPTEYFDLGDNEDILINLRNIAKTTGLLPTDLSRNNLNQNGGGLMFNSMSYQNATYTDQLQRNIQLAEHYKWMAYEKLGLTPQAMGSPSQYSTAEGIQVGQQATYAQNYNIDQMLLENKRSNIEIHMSVAQYCQMNNKDANYIYMASDNEIQFLQSIKDDENFGLRKIDVRPIYNPQKYRAFQDLKRALINNNTMGNDAYALSELVLSDDFLELKEAALKARNYADSVRREDYENQQQLKQKEIDEKLQIHNDDIAVRRERNLAMVKSAELNALGRTADNTNQDDGTEIIEQNARMYLKDKELENKREAEYNKIKRDLQIASDKINYRAKEIELKQQELDLKREQLSNQRYVADAKNRDSIINKN